MAYVVALLIHILIACATFGFIAASAYALVREKFSWYKNLITLIGACAITETISGFALTVFSPDLSVIRVGLHLFFYLALCLIVEVALILNSRRVWIG